MGGFFHIHSRVAFRDASKSKKRNSSVPKVRFESKPLKSALKKPEVVIPGRVHLPLCHECNNDWSNRKSKYRVRRGR